MASRLTGARGERGRQREGQTAAKGGQVSSKGLFLQTQPLDTSNQCSGSSWPQAQLHQQQRPVQDPVPLIKQDIMVFYHTRPASNTTPWHFLSHSTTATPRLEP
ncbi:hypothetical protein JOB18_048611 [Solea senegalensis]|uniref:Uncharacterized protein n=1 Tax=Solea senegalensis TaxID=28829 RepID=A0AAV6QPQ5_SOLSE|nr:hypothetical protein JOB18_048611 [Solea senegalensis]